jgi:hypothetical protein
MAHSDYRRRCGAAPPAVGDSALAANRVLQRLLAARDLA